MSAASGVEALTKSMMLTRLAESGGTGGAGSQCRGDMQLDLVDDFLAIDHLVSRASPQRRAP